VVEIERLRSLAEQKSIVLNEPHARFGRRGTGAGKGGSSQDQRIS